MSIESEVKKLTGTIEKLIDVIGDVSARVDTGPFNPVTETKVVEPEVTKEAPVKPTVKRTTTKVEPDATSDGEGNSNVTTRDVQALAQKKCNSGADRSEVKAKISSLGAETISKLDQVGLNAMYDYLNTI